MPGYNKQVDNYIDKAAEFARPVLIYLRNLVHKGCPQVEETIKWGCPHFMYNGTILCSMAAFKQHCVLGFRKAALMKDHARLTGNNEHAMGHLGRITSLKDLPATKVLLGYIKEAAALNATGAKLPVNKAAKTSLVTPTYIKKALAANTSAAQAYKALPNSHRKEYITWIADAKKEETRQRRIQQMLQKLIATKPTIVK